MSLDAQGLHFYTLLPERKHREEQIRAAGAVLLEPIQFNSILHFVSLGLIRGVNRQRL